MFSRPPKWTSLQNRHYSRTLVMLVGTPSPPALVPWFEAFYPPLTDQNTNTLYEHVSWARLQEENPQLPAAASPGDWGNLEVNRSGCASASVTHGWLLLSQILWLPVCLDGLSPEGAFVHSGLEAASLSRVMEGSSLPGLSLPFGSWMCQIQTFKTLSKFILVELMTC